jgi:hypothetical protein
MFLVSDAYGASGLAHVNLYRPVPLFLVVHVLLNIFPIVFVVLKAFFVFFKIIL